MVEPRGSEHEVTVVAGTPFGPSGERPGGVSPRRRGGAVVRRVVKKKVGAKVTI
jgi:hypothetical protein